MLNTWDYRHAAVTEQTEWHLPAAAAASSVVDQSRTRVEFEETQTGVTRTATIGGKGEKREQAT